MIGTAKIKLCSVKVIAKEASFSSILL